MPRGSDDVTLDEWRALPDAVMLAHPDGPIALRGDDQWLAHEWRCPACARCIVAATFGHRPRHRMTVHEDGTISLRDRLTCPCGWSAAVSHNSLIDEVIGCNSSG